MPHNCIVREAVIFFMGALFGASMLLAGIFLAVYLDSCGAPA